MYTKFEWKETFIEINWKPSYAYSGVSSDFTKYAAFQRDQPDSINYFSFYNIYSTFTLLVSERCIVLKYFNY